MDASPPLAIPRLRLPRYSPQSQALSPIAGPSHSHNPDYLHVDEDDEDAESTPRMSTSAIPDKSSPRSPATPSLPSEPTARLRALLARVPNSPNGATPHARPPLTLPSFSEPESDFEPPHSTATASSIARESLKEIFSHALRDPGNTPRKNGRPRRNSIDASEVEASPRVEEERAKYKGKRRTLSDEEAEKSRYTDSSEVSHRSSAASTFAALKQRLDQSTSAMPSLSQAQMVMDMSMPPLNSSTDTAMPPAMKVDASSDTPPRATSTPMRTFQMSAHLGMHSNLLEQDSEMQDALQGMDSYESAPVPRQRHSSTPAVKDSVGPGPTPRSPPHGHSSARPLSWSSHSKSHSVNKLPPPPPSRRSSEDLDSASSRPSSSLSGADYQERQDDTRRERMHHRERGWNSPVPKLPPKSPGHSARHDPNHRHSWGSPSNGRGSPAHRLNRKGSAASLSSLASTDDGCSSSRASSVASRSEYKERVEEVEKERNKEREREWNKPHPKLSRSSSNLNLKSERVRTISTPSRPGSSASYLSPTTATLHRHGSASSLSSSRPSSPTTSVSGESVEMEIEHEIDHLRERNWNSPHPDWHLHNRRSLSPLPRSRPGSPTGTPPHVAPPRSRTNSITHGNSLSVPSSVPRSKSPVGDRVPRPRSPMPPSSVGTKASSHERPQSPVNSPPAKAESSNSVSGSRFGWSFPQHKHKSLPPLELDEESPRRPLSRPSSRSSLAASASTPSHIPVRSPRKNGHASTASMATSSASIAFPGSTMEKKNRHRRSVTEFSESVGALPPKIEVSSSDDLPPVPIVDGHDDFSSSASEDDGKIVGSTPTAKPVPLPPPGPSTTPVLEPPAHVSNGHAEGSQPSPGSELASPPLTPPGADSQPMFNLQTPPRRPQFHTPKQEFETPPPPRGMPDLPGPPSSDEEEANHTPSVQSPEAQGDLTSLKTPRPPGAWMATPAPSRQVTNEAVERAGSAPPPDFNSSASSDSGLATPPATLSRATSLPPQTPAPPGGWVATPAAGNVTRRGSILKVRFDLKAETASEVTTEGEGSLESRFEGEPQTANSSAEAAPFNGDASAAFSVPHEESSAEPPPTPPSIRDRTRKKSPGIRIVDAFGREQVETAPPSQESVTVPVVSNRKPTVPSTPRNAPRPVSTATPRNRSGIRVVDAMGREIEEEPAAEGDSVMSQTPLTHNEALSRIKDTLSCMKHELSDADRSSDDAIFDARMYAALQEQCKAAQDARSKISQSLQIAQTADSELKGKYWPFRNRIAKSARLPLGGTDIRLDWNPLSWRFVVGFILVQLLLLALMYRYSLVQARKIFLTTYYDSFYPELYIYLLKPDTTQHTIPSCPSWSFLTIFSSLQRDGFLGVVSDAWASASCAVSTYFQSTWVGWHYAQDTVTHSWPPT